MSTIPEKSKASTATAPTPPVTSAGIYAIPSKRAPSGWRFKAVVRVDGVQRAKTFATERQAIKWQSATRVDRDRGDYKAPPPRSSPRFETFARKVLAERASDESDHGITASTAQRYEQHLKTHVYPHWKNRPVGQITQQMCKDLIRNATSAVPDAAGVRQPLAASTKHVLHAVVSMILKQAMQEKYLRENPAKGVPLPVIKRTKCKILEHEQVLALIAASPQHLADLWTIAIGTGMRQSELLALGADRAYLLLEKDKIEVREAVFTPDVGRPVVVPRLKSASAERDLPMTPEVRAALERRIAATPEGLFWPAADGGPLRRGSINEQWKTCLGKAGLPLTLTMHATRHTYASWLIANGMTLLSVMKRMGHATVDETIRTYGHLFTGDDRKIVDAMSKIFKAA